MGPLILGLILTLEHGGGGLVFSRERGCTISNTYNLSKRDEEKIETLSNLHEVEDLGNATNSDGKGLKDLKMITRRKYRYFSYRYPIVGYIFPRE